MTRVTPDLILACDKSASTTARQAAWERYEIGEWHEAHKSRGLDFRSLDDAPVGLDGESIRKLVYQRMCADGAPLAP